MTLQISVSSVIRTISILGHAWISLPDSHAQTAISTGRTERVTASISAPQANNWSEKASISGDGRFVTFTSLATNLVAPSTPPILQIFLHDRKTGVTELMSVNSLGEPGNKMSVENSISADGRYVAFSSWATNLVSPSPVAGVYVRDRLAGTTQIVSLSSSGIPKNSYGAKISGDGRYVAFLSYDALVPSDTNNWGDVYLRDRALGKTILISVGPGGEIGNSTSTVGSVSQDGRFVAFQSEAKNFLPGIPNGATQVWLRDTIAQTTQLVSSSSSGEIGNGPSNNEASVSADGRWVAFESSSTNLVAGDGNAATDIFLRDTQNGTTQRISLGIGGVEANGSSFVPAISADGSCVAFLSDASNLISQDTNLVRDIFVCELPSLKIRQVNLDSDGNPPNSETNSSLSYQMGISATGRFVAFPHNSPDLVAGDTNATEDIFVRDRIALSFEKQPGTNLSKFALANCADEAGNHAQVLMSFTGNAGLAIGNLLLPISFDRLTRFTLSSPNYQMAIGADGSAQTPTVAFPPLPPGTTIWAGAVTFDPTSQTPVSVTGGLSFVLQ